MVRDLRSGTSCIATYCIIDGEKKKRHCVIVVLISPTLALEF